jgi:hypothetical protein
MLARVRSLVCAGSHKSAALELPGMSLDVAVPEPPVLNEVDPNEYDDAEVGGDDEYHRDDLERFLQQGAWADAFEQWAADSSLDAADWVIVEDLDLLDRFDFFWDDFADRVGYHAPGLPEDWRERDLHPELDSWETVSGINAATPASPNSANWCVRF